MMLVPPFLQPGVRILAFFPRASLSFPLFLSNSSEFCEVQVKLVSGGGVFSVSRVVGWPVVVHVVP